jgi:hypothetical protein
VFGEGTVIALAIPLLIALITLAGAAVARPLGHTRGTVVAGMLAQGFGFGLWASGVLALAFESAGITAYVWPLAVVVLVAAVAGARVLRGAAKSADSARTSGRSEILFSLVLLLLTCIAALDAVGKPVIPWDAWNTWLYRAEAMRLVPGAQFAPSEVAATVAGSFDLAAAHYPRVLTAALVWLARLTQMPVEGALLLLWPIAYAAQAVLLFALGNSLLERSPFAALPAWLWMLTPLALTHAALAGYMDLFVGLYISLALAMLAAGGGRIDWRVLLALIMLAGIKVEGLIWAAVLGIGALAMQRPRRVWAAIGIAFALVLALVALSGGRFEAFDAALVLAWNELRMPYLGGTTLALRPVFDEAAIALFATLTFGVSVYALLALLLARALAGRGAGDGSPQHRWQLAANTFAWLGFAFVVFLFLFTDASRWAENQTSLSRVILQLLPAWLLIATVSAVRASEKTSA